MKLSRAKKLLLLGIILVLIDQIIKILVKTNMFLGQHIDVIGQWFKLLFIENEGFAFGWSFGGVWGKYILSAFRICLAALLIWWIGKMCRRNDAETAAGRKAPIPTGFLVGLTIITAGALGNVIDCFFYGLLFSESSSAAIASFGGHYAPFMQGKVVDMFYFSDYQYDLASVAPDNWRKAFHLLRPRLQLCRQLRFCRSLLPDSLPVEIYRIY